MHAKSPAVDCRHTAEGKVTSGGMELQKESSSLRAFCVKLSLFKMLLSHYKFSNSLFSLSSCFACSSLPLPLSRLLPTLSLSSGSFLLPHLHHSKPSRSPSPLQASEKEKESPVELTERCFRELLGRAAYGNIKNAVTPVLM